MCGTLFKFARCALLGALVVEVLKEVVVVFTACVPESLDRKIKGPLVSIDHKLVAVQAGAWVGSDGWDNADCTAKRK